MNFSRYFTTCIISCITSFVSLNAAMPADMQNQIRADLAAQKYRDLGFFIKEKLDQQIVTLKELRKIAQKQQANNFIRAIDATNNFLKEGQNLELTTGDFLRIALFIETDLQSYIARQDYYLQKSRTGLPRIIEYDPSNGATFIVADGIPSAFLGQGARKTAYKAILYNNAAPKIVVRAEQHGGMDEAKFTKTLRGSQGIYTMEGLASHERRGKNYTTIYSQLYNAGDLQKAFDENIQFSLVEKMRIAYNILQGLEALRSKNIVHRDLGAKNIFLNRSQLKQGQQRIDAVIADLGCAKRTRQMSEKRAQVSFKNTAPEGIFFDKLRGADFFATDLYAAGLVLYRLIYGKYAKWQEKQIHGSHDHKYHRLTCKINQKTRSRRDYLLNQQSLGLTSSEEDFELIVLRMVSPNPKKRRTAARLLQDMQRIYDTERDCIIHKKIGSKRPMTKSQNSK